MPEVRIGWRGWVWLVVLLALAVGLGLGSSTRLTYHEAFVAQGAREIVTSGHWWHPSIGGLPWLEKPPLPFWLAAALGWCAGDVSPTVARLPSALAATGLIVGVVLLTVRRYGREIGLLAGAIQATTAWTVLRGRLAEADILLACLITWTLLAFDRLRGSGFGLVQGDVKPSERWVAWRWAFFGLLGATSLVKGTGFGAVLVLSVVVGVLAWDHNRVSRLRLLFPVGWLLVCMLTVAWPLAMIAEHGFKVIELWVLHVSQRVGAPSGHGPFAGESWREYVPNVLGQALPWTPLALVGAWHSLGRALRGHGHGRGRLATGGLPDHVLAGDRLLWAWAVLPLILVSLPGARNAHYAIHAAVPWSVWAALGMARLGGRLIARGWSPSRLRRCGASVFVMLAAAYGLGFWLLGPRLDRRGLEWAFYESAARQSAPEEPLVLLYDDWDREPYPTPFGPIPHDLAVRLYYLNRPASWHFRATETASLLTDEAESLVVIGRARDLPHFERLGRVEILARGPSVRWDRTYLMARVRPDPEASREPATARRARLGSPALR
jgi:4-amino-4-deoxy-L-arabinose transferase-like glycosyltransferase